MDFVKAFEKLFHRVQSFLNEILNLNFLTFNEASIQARFDEFFENLNKHINNTQYQSSRQGLARARKAGEQNATTQLQN